jgi:CRISPR-associated protein Cmr2
MRAIAARKAIRDFEVWEGSPVPKSSLDPGRETVWDKRRMRTAPKDLLAKLRLTFEEQLDAVGVTKRLGFGSRQFPSVARIAAEQWISRIEAPDLANALRLCEKLRAKGLITYAGYPQYAKFPFEGAALFPTRMKEILADPEDTEGLVLVRELRREIATLRRKYQAPTPYMAMVAADGDGMGRAISMLQSASEHREFSRTLALFAGRARQIVSDHGGTAVFTGGDDVLAMLPVDRALPCVAAIRGAFVKALGQYGATLSSGIAYMHSSEDLEDIVQTARQAEQTAKKPDRDGLALAFAPRGQEPTIVRRRWSEGAYEHFTGLLASYRNGELPDGLAYELGVMARHYAQWPSNEALTKAMQLDAGRVWRRKRTAGKTAPTAASTLAKVQSAGDLLQLSNELVIARSLVRSRA